MVNLTKEDAEEIYYALSSKIFIPPVCDDLEWAGHLQAIMDKIGPEGQNLVTEGIVKKEFELSQQIIKNAQNAVKVVNELETKLAEKDKELAHWKSNHADMVARNKILTQRPDLPTNRIKAYDELVRLQGELDKAEVRIQKALQLAIEDGPCDGEHHKTWVIDQMVRALTGHDYKKFISKVKNWDVGLVP